LHEDGEVDVRGTYTVVAVAYLLNLLTPQLMAGVSFVFAVPL
jgi:protein farnesyltransferase subunit beta